MWPSSFCSGALQSSPFKNKSTLSTSYTKFHNHSMKYSFKQSKLFNNRNQIYRDFNKSLEMQEFDENDIRMLNVNDWALWRAKLNETIILDLIRDISAIQIEPHLAKSIYNLNGIHKYESPFLKPDLFMLYGMPRIKSIATSLKPIFCQNIHQINNFIQGNEESSQNFMHTENTNLTCDADSKMTLNSEEDPNNFNFIDMESTNFKEFFKEQEKLLTAASTSVDISSRITCNKHEAMNIAKKIEAAETKSCSEVQPTQNISTSSMSKIITGVNVREKVKAFETNTNSSSSDQPPAKNPVPLATATTATAKFNKNSNATCKLSKECANLNKLKSSVDSNRPNENAIKMKECSLRSLKKKFGKINNKDSDNNSLDRPDSATQEENSSSFEFGYKESQHMFQIDQKQNFNNGLTRAAILSSSLSNSSQFISPPLPGLLPVEHKLDRSNDVDLKRDINVNSLILNYDTDYDAEFSAKNNVNNQNSNGNLFGPSSNAHFEQSIHFNGDFGFGLKNSKLADVLKAVDGDITFGNNNINENLHINNSNNLEHKQQTLENSNVKNKTSNIFAKSTISSATTSTAKKIFSLSKISRKSWFRSKKKEKGFKNEKYNYLAPLKKMLRSKAKPSSDEIKTVAIKAATVYSAKKVSDEERIRSKGKRQQHHHHSNHHHSSNSRHGHHYRHHRHRHKDKEGESSQHRNNLISSNGHNSYQKCDKYRHRSNKTETEAKSDKKSNENSKATVEKNVDKKEVKSKNLERSSRSKHEIKHHKHSSRQSSVKKVKATSGHHAKKSISSQKRENFSCSKKDKNHSISHRMRKKSVRTKLKISSPIIQQNKRSKQTNNVDIIRNNNNLNGSLIQSESKVAKYLNDPFNLNADQLNLDSCISYRLDTDFDDIIDLVSSSGSSLTSLSPKQTNKPQQNQHEKSNSPRSNSWVLSTSLIYSDDSTKLDLQENKNMRSSKNEVDIDINKPYVLKPENNVEIDNFNIKNSIISNNKAKKKQLIIDAIEKAKDLKPPNAPVPLFMSKNKTSNSSFSSIISFSTVSRTRLNVRKRSCANVDADVAASRLEVGSFGVYP